MAKRKTPGLNTQSTADIAFLLLCYFLMVSTMDQQSGLQRRLPPMPTNEQKQEDTKVNKRNIIIVKINSSDRLFAGDQLLDVSQLKDKIKEFITNPNDDPNLPAVQNELVKAVNEVRNDFCRQHFGKVFNACNETQQKIAKDAIPQNISEAEPKDVTKK